MPVVSTAEKTAVAPGKNTRTKRVRATGLKPGKKSWVHGTKLKFFEARATDWKQANEGGFASLTTFYTNITSLYLLKYGHDLKDKEDLAEDVADPVNPYDPMPGASTLTAEEAQRRSEDVVRIRKRIAAWYCRKYKGVDKMEQNAFAELLRGVADNNGRGQPRKAQPLHFYSRKFYDERVKARFEERWKVEVQRSKDLNEVKAPSEIKVRNEVTQEVFNEESDDFKEELKLAIDAELVSATRAWELTRGQSETKTPEELNVALRSAAFYLDPLANAIRDKFGMNCSILLCGPVGERGGAIDVRSVHAGSTIGALPKKWYEFNRMEYEAVERSMIKFSARCFSEDDCRARAVGESAEGGGVAAGSSQTLTTPSAASGGGVAAGDGPPEAPASSHGAGQAAAAVTTEGARGPGSGDGGRMETQGGGATMETEEGGAGDVDSAQPHRVWDRPDKMKWTDEMRTAFGAFSMGDKWGAKWEDCIDAWLDFEAGCGYRDRGGKMGGEDRPAEVTAFINSRRKWWVPPVVKNPGRKGEEGTFAGNWWAWWTSLQPRDRVRAGGDLAQEEDAGRKWGNLPRMNGKNGMVMVMATLVWWGKSVEPEPEAGEVLGDAVGGSEKADWVHAVEDVTWVMKQLVASGELSAKETRKRARNPAPVKKKTAAPRRKRAQEDDDDDEDEDEDDDREDDDDEERAESSGEEDEDEARPAKKARRKAVVEAPPRATRSAVAAAARPRRKAAGAGGGKK